MRKLKTEFPASDFGYVQLGMLCSEFNCLPRAGGILDQHFDEMIAIGEVKKFFLAKMPKNPVGDKQWQSLLR